MDFYPFIFILVNLYSNCSKNELSSELCVVWVMFTSHLSTSFMKRAKKKNRRNIITNINYYMAEINGHHNKLKSMCNEK